MNKNMKKMLMVCVCALLIMVNIFGSQGNVSFATTNYKIGQSHSTQDSTTYYKYIAYSDSANTVVSYKKTVEFYNDKLSKATNLNKNILLSISQVAAYSLPIILDPTFVTSVTYALPLSESSYGLYLDLRDYKTHGDAETWRIKAMDANKKLSSLIKETEQKRLQFLNYANRDKTFIRVPGGNGK